MLALGLVNRKMETARGTITHHLILPCTTIFSKLVLKDLRLTTVDTDCYTVALTCIEGPEGHGVEEHIHGICLDSRDGI